MPTTSLGKGRLAGKREALGGVTPIPLRATLWGLPTPVYLTLSKAVLDPAALGLNLTLIVQLAAAARVVPHVVVFKKSAALIPVMVGARRGSAAEPIFVSVTVCARLVVPTFWLAKATLVVDMLAVV